MATSVSAGGLIKELRDDEMKLYENHNQGIYLVAHSVDVDTPS